MVPAIFGALAVGALFGFCCCALAHRCDEVDEHFVHDLFDIIRNRDLMVSERSARIAERDLTIADLFLALKQLHAYDADYIRINNMGAEPNAAMQIAQEALARAEASHG
jgi:hypothetical protein